MGWLKSLSSKWSLKKSFIIYLLIFLMLGIILAKINLVLVENYEIETINEYVRKDIIEGKEYYIPYEQNLSALRAYLDRALLFYKDLAVVIHSILFSIFGFYIYYIHKLREPVDYICNIREDNINDIPNGDNELIFACKKITNEMKSLQEEKIKVWNQYDAFNHMVSSMSHDMKNPLTIVKGNVDILEMIDIENDNNIKSETIQSIKNNLIRIEKYLDRVNYLQSMDQLRINKKSIHILGFIETLKNNAKMLNSNKHIHWITPKEDIIINIDTHHIEEGFENVLNNALTHANTNIYIDIGVKDKKMLISIHDDGKGFSGEALKYATQKFYSENPQPGNMGLGLNITKHILERHGGDLIIKNHNNGALVEMAINL
ncbi:sensor histidine kinase [Clostridium sp. Cult2]|uniref:sensor histidine kinase n=1 Tax=Clostridium sp. Cult2 TaxID=2079003 RepID=UPI001F1CCB10|nr:HAMP domain-containing sensor histidine kinase [Clostridium sp. Cult2]MCF6464498.1 hypothetical protein [Clostridium sp. Cult2]